MVARWEELGGYLENGKEEDAEARKLKHLTTKPCPKWCVHSLLSLPLNTSFAVIYVTPVFVFSGVRIEKNGGCPVSSDFSFTRKKMLVYM